MREISRRTWLAALGAAPLAGGAIAFLQSPDGSSTHASVKLTARQRIQRRNLPNVELVSHRGERVRFYDDLVKDKKVLINFMYAECEGICVPVTANLAKVQRMLEGRVGRDIFFYSITLQPEKDTPEALRHYAEMHRVGPGWLFLTGGRPDVELLRRSLGFVYTDPVEDADKDNHVGMVRYGVEPSMRWGATPGMANPHHILRTILWDLDRSEQISRSAPPQV